MRGEFYKMEYEAWDEGTDTLSLELEGAYLRFCHQMYRRKGPVVDDKLVLSRLWKCHPNKAAKLRDDLIAAGKITPTQDGHLSNTRVTQELDTRETQSTQRSHAGKTGGTRSGEVRRKPLKNNNSDEAFASSKTNQRREEEKRDSEPNGSGAAAPADLLGESPPTDWRTKLFRDGLRSLVEITGSREQACRSLLGKWLGQAKDDARRVLRLIDDAKEERVADPVAWIESSLRQRQRPSQSVENMLFARH